MDPRTLIRFLSVIEKLKCNTRHSWTSSGRRESVAEHCWRTTLMAFLLKDEFPDIDMNTVMYMCLIHDFGEAVTGDIPSFEKSEKDEQVENDAVAGLLTMLPDKTAAELAGLFDQLLELKTPEAKMFKALDKMEAVLQHNEADLSTWLPLEYELNQSYGEESVSFSDFLSKLKKEANLDTKKKIHQIDLSDEKSAEPAVL